MEVLAWTDERVEQLKKLWETGRSASQIAAELGGASRNAVIGKIHRLGLSGRAKKPSEQQPEKIRKRAERRAKYVVHATAPASATAIHAANIAAADQRRIELEAPPVIPVDVPIEQRVTLLQLSDDNCRFPFGDPQLPGFYFCGAKVRFGSSYCQRHHAETTEPPSERRRGRPVAAY